MPLLTLPTTVLYGFISSIGSFLQIKTSWRLATFQFSGAPASWDVKVDDCESVIARLLKSGIVENQSHWSSRSALSQVDALISPTSPKFYLSESYHHQKKRRWDWRGLLCGCMTSKATTKRNTFGDTLKKRNCPIHASPRLSSAEGSSCFIFEALESQLRIQRCSVLSAALKTPRKAMESELRWSLTSLHVTIKSINNWTPQKQMDP